MTNNYNQSVCARTFSLSGQAIGGKGDVWYTEEAECSVQTHDIPSKLRVFFPHSLRCTSHI